MRPSCTCTCSCAGVVTCSYLFSGRQLHVRTCPVCPYVRACTHFHFLAGACGRLSSPLPLSLTLSRTRLSSPPLSSLSLPCFSHTHRHTCAGTPTLTNTAHARTQPGRPRVPKNYKFSIHKKFFSSQGAAGSHTWGRQSSGSMSWYPRMSVIPSSVGTTCRPAWMLT